MERNVELTSLPNISPHYDDSDLYEDEEFYDEDECEGCPWKDVCDGMYKEGNTFVCPMIVSKCLNNTE